MSRTLIEAARDAARHAHAPYSKFGVGAALLLDNGDVVTGCNLENASYGVTLCAEAVALGTLNSQGLTGKLREVAVVGGLLDLQGIKGSAPVRPCGRCRQMLVEAGQRAGIDLVIHCASADLSAIETHKLSELVPLPFGPADLGFA